MVDTGRMFRWTPKLLLERSTAPQVVSDVSPVLPGAQRGATRLDPRIGPDSHKGRDNHAFWGVGSWGAEGFALRRGSSFRLRLGVLCWIA